MRLKITLAYRTAEGTYGRLEREMEESALSNVSLQRLALSLLPRHAMLASLKIEERKATFDDLMIDWILVPSQNTASIQGELPGEEN